MISAIVSNDTPLRTVSFSTSDSDDVVHERFCVETLLLSQQVSIAMLYTSLGGPTITFLERIDVYGNEGELMFVCSSSCM